jgi:hypothetical protein
MANSAFQTAYRQEIIAGFEQRQALLRRTVTTESMIKGGSAVFLVQDSNSATAVNRGLNGRLPYRSNNLTQSTATLKEWHDPVEITGFNIFASQGDIVTQMQKDSIGVINRKIDDDIIAQADTFTNDTGSATTMSLELFLYAKTILGNAEVPSDGKICAVLSPAAMAYLHQTTEFGSSDYVGSKPIQSGQAFYDDTVKVYDFLGVKVIEHPRLTGNATSAEKCFMYHESAIGHGIDSKGIQSYMDYDEKEDLSWVRNTVYMGSKLLQQSGGVLINHDGSAFAAQ